MALGVYARRVQQLVPRGQVLLPPVVLHQPPHRRPLRVPEDEPAARVLLDREEVERLPDRTVVAPAGAEMAWVSGVTAVP